MPAGARLSLNRCNLPAIILGSLTYQKHPVELKIDGVHELHKALFAALAGIATKKQRYIHFTRYMKSSFLLDYPDQAGMDGRAHRQRVKADYLHLLRGWFFDSNGREAAALKGWVESRFGLLTRSHNGPLIDVSSANYWRFQAERVQAMYNTNSLEMQLDLIYSYCQFEARLLFHNHDHTTLYRGLNNLEYHEHLAPRRGRTLTLLLNNLNSFTRDRDRAETFGDHVIQVEVPVAKLLYYPGLLPGVLYGEAEHVVIGGAYEATLCVE